MTLFIVPTVTFDIVFGFKSGKTCKKIDAHKTVPMSHNMVLLITPFFLSKSHDPRCSVKPKMCSLFDKSFRTIAYVITLHQVHLSQMTKHWDSFVSHCMMSRDMKWLI